MIPRALSKQIFLKRLIVCCIWLTLPMPVLADYFSEAQIYFSQGKYNYAIVQLKNALRENPNHGKARLLLGSALLEENKVSAAEKEILKAESLGISESEIALPMARISLLQGKYDEAFSYLHPEIRDQLNDQAQVYAVLGQAALAKKQLAKARQFFEKATQLGQQPSALIGLARINFIEQHPEQALELLQTALEQDPDSVEALYAQGQILGAQNKLNAAANAFSKVLELQPGNVLSRLARAETYLRQNDFNHALEDIQIILEAAPNLPQANFTKARIYFAQKNFNESITAAEQVYKYLPDHTGNLLLLGSAHFALANYQQTKFYLEQMLELQPGHWAASKMLGAGYLKLGEFEAAKSLLENLDQSKSHQDAQLLNLLGQAYFKTGQFEEGNAVLTRAKSIAPDMQGIDTQLAIGELATGNLEQAERHLISAFEKEQSPVTTGTMLVMFHIRNRNWDKAEAAIQEALLKYPEKSTFYHLRGLAEKQQGHRMLARKALQDAIDSNPEYTPAEVDLGKMDLEDGAMDSARAHYLNAIRLDPNHLQAHLAMAQISQKSGDMDQAERWLKQARSKNPDAILPVMALVNYYVQAQQPDKSLREAENFHARHQASILAKDLLVKSYLANQDTESALSQLQQILEIKPDSLSHRGQLIQLLVSQDQLQKALDETDVALQQAPNSLQLMTIKTGILIKSEHWPQAESLIDAISKQGHTTLVERLRGDLAYEQNNLDSAQMHYLNAYNNNPTEYLNDAIVNIHLKQGDSDRATEILQHHLKRHPGSLKHRFMLANLYQQQNQNQQAIEHYEITRQAQPDNAIVLNNLAWLYWLDKDPRGLEYARRASELAPDNTDILDTLGWITLHEGDPEQALTILKNAASKAVFNPEIRYHHAVAMKENGHKEQARTELKRIIRDFSSFPSRKQAQALLSSIQ